MTKPDFTEDYVCCSIDVYFTLISSYHDEFSVTPISRQSEKELGHDASMMVEFTPFYMQFKRPYGYDYNEDFYFCAVAHQHNILYKLFQNGKNVAYVVPRFMRKEKYRRCLLSCVEALKYKKKRAKDTRDALQNNKTPNLPAHACIPPEHEIKDQKTHRYRFNPNTIYTNFLSKAKYVKGTQDFEDWVKDKYFAFLEKKSKVITQETAEKELKSFINIINSQIKERQSIFMEKIKVFEVIVKNLIEEIEIFESSKDLVTGSLIKSYVGMENLDAQVKKFIGIINDEELYGREKSQSLRLASKGKLVEIGEIFEKNEIDEKSRNDVIMQFKEILNVQRLNIEEINSVVQALAVPLILDPFEEKIVKNGIEGWLWFGDKLMEKYGIHQYAFVKLEAKES